MVEPLRHRQTKGAATDMPGLPPPRHFPTLPDTAVRCGDPKRRLSPNIAAVWMASPGRLNPTVLGHSASDSELGASAPALSGQP